MKRSRLKQLPAQGAARDPRVRLRRPTLEAALWAFARTSSFREGALLAVNLGEDADTTGAVFGQLAGAYYGAEAIPAAWRNLLARRDEIVHLATVLFEDAAPSSTAG